VAKPSEATSPSTNLFILSSPFEFLIFGFLECHELPQTALCTSNMFTVTDVGLVLSVLLGTLAFLISWFAPPQPTDELRKTHVLLNIPDSESRLRKDVRNKRPTSNSPLVQSLWVYPVKSCRGVELEKCLVTRTGLKWDRIYTIARKKESGGYVFVSQRLPRFNALATVGVEIWVPRPETVGLPERIVLHFPRKIVGVSAPLTWIRAKTQYLFSLEPPDLFRVEALLPLQPSSEDFAVLDTLTVQRDTIMALNISNSIAPLLEKLKDYLGVPDELFLFMALPPDIMPRTVERCVPSKLDLGYQPVINFQDGVKPTSYFIGEVSDHEPILTKN
jgi:hypothetical protein